MLLSSDTCMYTCVPWVYWDHSLHLLERVLCLFITSLLSDVIEAFKMLSWLYGQCKNQSKTYFSWDDRGIFGYKMEFHAFLLGFLNCSFKNIFFSFFFSSLLCCMCLYVKLWGLCRYVFPMCFLALEPLAQMLTSVAVQQMRCIPARFSYLPTSRVNFHSLCGRSEGGTGRRRPSGRLLVE